MKNDYNEIQPKGFGFKDIIPPSGEKLDIMIRDRNGNEVGVILNVGSSSETHVSQKPLSSRALSEEIEGVNQ